MKQENSINDLCPCGSEKKYSDCCQPLHQGLQVATTALQLMKSRYAAYVKKEFQYLRDTTHRQAYDKINHDQNEQWAKAVHFFKLEILNHNEEGNKATVEFKAHFDNQGQEEVHHEKSYFRKDGGSWFFRQ